MTRADDILARMRDDTDSDWAVRLAVDVLRAETQAGTPVTGAEVDVLRCLAAGTGIDGAADLLAKSRNTVASQLVTARRRLRAKDTPHAVALAIRQGLIA